MQPISLNTQNATINNSEKVLNQNLRMDFSKDFYVIAHRGASAYYPENTIIAFKAAVGMQADMIELDVQLSKDKVPIVFHDERLEDKSDGKGLVSDFTLSELKMLDAGSWFNSKFKGEKIPTLKEVLEYTRDKILVNIEIKTEAVTDVEKDGVVDLVVQLIDELKISDQVLISSFDYRVFERVHNEGKIIKTALLYEIDQSEKKTPLQLVEGYKVDAFNCSKNQLSEEWSNELDKAKVPYFVYTVNAKVEMTSIIKDGAKGIFSDKPDLLKEVANQIFR